MSKLRNRQKGQEILEFGLVAVVFVPLLMGAFVTGLNLIRSIQAKQVCRDLTDIYIHGGDFSLYTMQQLAQRLAQGLNLQIGTSYTGNQKANTGNSGYGLVTLTEVQWVGDQTNGAICKSVGSANCVNHDSFVYLQRVQFGNGTLANANTVQLGTPTPGITTASDGTVANPYSDSAAKVPNPVQNTLNAQWQVSSGGRQPLQDGQFMYVVETYFQSPDLTLGSFFGNGVYAKYFF